MGWLTADVRDEDVSKALTLRVYSMNHTTDGGRGSIRKYCSSRAQLEGPCVLARLFFVSFFLRVPALWLFAAGFWGRMDASFFVPSLHLAMMIRAYTIRAKTGVNSVAWWLEIHRFRVLCRPRCRSTSQRPFGIAWEHNKCDNAGENAKETSRGYLSSRSRAGSQYDPSSRPTVLSASYSRVISFYSRQLMRTSQLSYPRLFSISNEHIATFSCSCHLGPQAQIQSSRT